MKVLLQDRDVAMRAFIRPMLAGPDVTVVEARNLWDSARLANLEAPDVLLLSASDVYMRGMVIPDMLRGCIGRIPSLLLGASGPCRAQTGRLAVDGYLPYPFDKQQLRDAIAAIFPTAPATGSQTRGRQMPRLQDASAGCHA